MQEAETDVSGGREGRCEMHKNTFHKCQRVVWESANAPPLARCHLVTCATWEGGYDLFFPSAVLCVLSFYVFFRTSSS